jgi:hypothetical protein
LLGRIGAVERILRRQFVTGEQQDRDRTRINLS